MREGGARGNEGREGGVRGNEGREGGVRGNEGRERLGLGLVQIQSQRNILSIQTHRAVAQGRLAVGSVSTRVLERSVVRTNDKQ